jgi:hypothetical protein
LRIVREGGETEPARLAYAYRQALGRPPRDEETKLLAELYRKHHQQFTADTDSAQALIKVGDAKTPNDVDPATLAAWTSVARVILNLHETITRN